MPPADVLDLSTVAVLPDPGDNAAIVSRDLPAGTRPAPTRRYTSAPAHPVSTSRPTWSRPRSGRSEP
jgi:hypothetical protein